MPQLYPNPISSTAGITVVAGPGLSGGGTALLGGSVFLSATGGSASTRNAYTVTPATDGVTQNFSIVNFPSGISLVYADVFVNGVLQTVVTNYSLPGGNAVNFTFPPALGDVINVVFSNPPGNRSQYKLTPVPNGVTTSFSFPADLPSSSYVDVYVNGILQTPGFTYLLNFTSGVWSIVFTTAPASGDIIEAVFAPAEQTTRNLYGLTPPPNGATVSFTILAALGIQAGIPTNPNIYVDTYVNGVYQTAGVNYNLNLVGGVWTVVFTTAPKTNDILEVVF